ncbi:MAG: hypothetical protein QXS54_13300, partial [Candidatus Methanomethylicaceae archaeon]
MKIYESQHGEKIARKFREIIRKVFSNINVPERVIDDFMKLREYDPKPRDLIEFLESKNLLQEVDSEHKKEVENNILNMYEYESLQLFFSYDFHDFLTHHFQDLISKILSIFKKNEKLIQNDALISTVYKKIANLLKIGDPRAVDILFMFPQFKKVLSQSIWEQVTSFINLKKTSTVHAVEFFSTFLDEFISELTSQIGIYDTFSIIRPIIEYFPRTTNIPSIKESELLGIAYSFWGDHELRTLKTMCSLASIIGFEYNIVEFLLMFLASKNHDLGITPVGYYSLSNCFEKHRRSYADHYRTEMANYFISQIFRNASSSSLITSTLANALLSISFPGWKDAISSGSNVEIAGSIKRERSAVVIGKIGDMAKIDLISALLRVSDASDIISYRNFPAYQYKKMIFLADFDPTFEQFLNLLIRQEIIQKVEIIGGKDEDTRLIHIFIETNPNIIIKTPDERSYSGREALWNLLVKELRKTFGSEIETWNARKYFTEELTNPEKISEWKQSLSYYPPLKEFLESHKIKLTWSLIIDTTQQQRVISLSDDEIKRYKEIGIDQVLDEIKTPLKKFENLPAHFMKYTFSTRIPAVKTSSTTFSDFLSRIHSGAAFPPEIGTVIDAVSNGRTVIIKGEPGAGTSTLALVVAALLKRRGWAILFATPYDTAFFKDFSLWIKKTRPSQIALLVEHAELLWDRYSCIPGNVPSILVVSGDDFLVKREDDIVVEIKRPQLVEEKTDTVDLYAFEIFAGKDKMSKKIKGAIMEYLRKIADKIMRDYKGSRNVTFDNVLEVIKVISIFSHYELPIECSFLEKILPQDTTQIINALREQDVLQTLEIS